MHTGEPLFSGSDQFDQMQKIVKLLGMVPDRMLDKASDHIKFQFFDRKKGDKKWSLRQTKGETKPSASSSSSAAAAAAEQAAAAAAAASSSAQAPRIVPSTDPIASLTEVITAGARQKKRFPPSETYNSQRNYELFIDLVYKMLAYDPKERIKSSEALEHPFITAGESSTATSATTAPTGAAFANTPPR